jgi:hypothetical protein
MFSTCIFCHRSLGANDLVEHFPVGGKLAFDSAKGRLWVVCAGCQQWNLTPLEERWEAVEECERLFEKARRRVSTDQIGLARVAERLDLIRIGSPLRPEFAAWRYGDRFRARRNRAIVAGTAVAGFVGGLMALGTGGAFIGAAGSVFVGVRKFLNRRTELAQAEHTLHRLMERRWGPVRGNVSAHIAQAGAHDWVLRLESPYARLDLFGSEALHTAHLVLPATNPHGAWPGSLRRAVAHLEDMGDPRLFFSKSIDLVKQTGLHHGPISSFPAPIRLALEMAAHEESERIAMQGELALLEQAWREAEEIAGIADDMFLPPTVTTTLDRLRRGAAPRQPPE